MIDSVPEDVKKKRLQEISETYLSLAATRNKRLIGTEQLVLLECVSPHENHIINYFILLKNNYFKAITMMMHVILWFGSPTCACVHQLVFSCTIKALNPINNINSLAPNINTLLICACVHSSRMK